MCEGDFKITSTGTVTGTFRFTSNDAPIITIKGNYLQTGGTVIYASTTGSTVLNVKGNYTISGGTVTPNLASGNSTINVDGNFLQDNGTLSITTGTVNYNIKGNFTFNGGTFTSTIGAFTFNGGTAQTIGGILSATFYNLSVANTLGNVALQTNQTVSHNLNFISGKLILDTKNLILSPTATITGYDNTKYIVADNTGTLQQNVIAGDNVFPIGTIANYAPVTLNNAGSANDFNVNVQTTFSPALPSGITQSVPFQWNITTAGVGNNVTATFAWTDGTDISGYTNPVIARHDGSNWITTTATRPTNFSASASGFTSFSPFVVFNESTAKIYVSTSGSDVAGDGTSGNPYQTVGKALSVLTTDNQTIQMATGSFISEDITISRPVIFETDGGVVTLKGITIAAGNLTLANNFSVSGDFTVNSTLTPNGKTITFTGGLTDQTISGTTNPVVFANIINDKYDGVNTPVSVLNINQNISVTDFTLNQNNILTVADNVTITGAGIFLFDQFSTLINKNHNGLIGATCALNGFTSFNINTYCTIELQGAFTTTASNLIYNNQVNYILNAPSGTFVLGYDLTCLGLTISNGNILDVTATPFNINIAEGWTNDGTFIEQTGTVTFNGNAGQISGTGTNSFYNLTINTFGDLDIIAAGSVIEVSNLMTIQKGAFQPGTANFKNVVIYGSFQPQENINITGDWTFKNGAFFVGNTKTVIFNGTTDQTIGGGNPGDQALFDNVDIDKNTGKIILGMNTDISLGSVLRLIKGTLDASTFTLSGDKLSFDNNTTFISKNPNGVFGLSNESITMPSGNITIGDPINIELQESFTSSATNLLSDAKINYTVNGTGKTVTLGADLTCRDLTMTAGTLDAADKIINIAGNFINNTENSEDFLIEI